MGRRSANEGSIFRRKKDGLWVAQYLVDTPDGKTKRKYIYGKRRKDVADKLAEVQKERREGLLLHGGPSPLPSSWLAGLSRRRNPCGGLPTTGESRC